MRVLWLCNIMLPVVAEHLHMTASNKEGWLTGLSNKILSESAKCKAQNESGRSIQLGVCFPVGQNLKDFRQVIRLIDDRGNENGQKLYAYGFFENTSTAEVYDTSMELRFQEILQDFKPDIVHIFGTEYPHTLAMTKAFGKPDKILIGIQGLCKVYAEHFRADLPDKVWKRTTFRDAVKRDNLRLQQQKYVMRGEYEQQAITLAGHITGRTDWDKKYTKVWNPNATYHFMNETLRGNFYKGNWNIESCKKYSIFLSQGDYPIKGLHYVLQAMPDILKQYPHTEIYVAGNSIVKTAGESGINGLKGQLKLESYGKYILTLMKEHHCMDKVHFLGRLNAEQMKEQYLNSHVFVCPSSIENSPNSVGEAMILGVPTVCADVGGISSIFYGQDVQHLQQVEHPADGIIYEPGNVQQLAAGICYIFDTKNAEKVADFCEHARTHARTTHDAEKNYRRLMEIYGEMMEKNE